MATFGARDLLTRDTLSLAQLRSLDRPLPKFTPTKANFPELPIWIQDSLRSVINAYNTATDNVSRLQHQVTQLEQHQIENTIPRFIQQLTPKPTLHLNQINNDNPDTIATDEVTAAHQRYQTTLRDIVVLNKQQALNDSTTGTDIVYLTRSLQHTLLDNMAPLQVSDERATALIPVIRSAFQHLAWQVQTRTESARYDLHKKEQKRASFLAAKTTAEDTIMASAADDVIASRTSIEQLVDQRVKQMLKSKTIALPKNEQRTAPKKRRSASTPPTTYKGTPTNARPRGRSVTASRKPNGKPKPKQARVSGSSAKPANKRTREATH